MYNIVQYLIENLEDFFTIEMTILSYITYEIVFSALDSVILHPTRSDPVTPASLATPASFAIRESFLQLGI